MTGEKKMKNGLEYHSKKHGDFIYKLCNMINCLEYNFRTTLVYGYC